MPGGRKKFQKLTIGGGGDYSVLTSGLLMDSHNRRDISYISLSNFFAETIVRHSVSIKLKRLRNKIRNIRTEYTSTISWTIGAAQICGVQKGAHKSFRFKVGFKSYISVQR